MCKHVAATLYGVGARLDKQPELLFALRGVDAKDMIVGAGRLLVAPKRVAAERKVLAEDNMAALFGLDMAVEGEAPSAALASAVGSIGSAPRQVDGRVAPKAASKRKTPEKRHPRSAWPPPTPPRAAGPKSKDPAKGTARLSAARKKAARGRIAMA